MWFKPLLYNDERFKPIVVSNKETCNNQLCNVSLIIVSFAPTVLIVRSEPSISRSRGARLLRRSRACPFALRLPVPAPAACSPTFIGIGRRDRTAQNARGRRRPLPFPTLHAQGAADGPGRRRRRRDRDLDRGRIASGSRGDRRGTAEGGEEQSGRGMDAKGRGENDDDARAPLLAAGPGRRRNSVASMRGEFVSRLPKKVLDAVDPEHPSHVDFSRSKGLLEGSFIPESQPLAAFSGLFFFAVGWFALSSVESPLASRFLNLVTVQQSWRYFRASFIYRVSW